MAERKAGSRSIGDTAVRAGTGKGWEEWHAILDAWGAQAQGSTKTAAYLRANHGLSAWWSHAVTSRYEWERGLRSETLQ
jgi:hypothetical protein